MPKTFKFELGQEVKDRVTGFKGIIMARTQYLTGCNRYGMQDRKLTKEGKPADWQNFDEDQIDLVGPGITHKVKDPGGPPRMEAQDMKQK